ncbi:MAG: hypothetical protein O0V67_03825 [Methanocorpusculum sp.]|nr:hypothetical protein [Methanocorpusculum sp.]
MGDSCGEIRGMGGKTVPAYCFDGKIWFPVPAVKANSLIRIIEEGGRMLIDVPDDLEPMTDREERSIGLYEGTIMGSKRFSAEERKTMVMGYLY